MNTEQYQGEAFSHDQPDRFWPGDQLGKIVKEAGGKMKAGKSDVSGNFTSEVLLHCPYVLLVRAECVRCSFR